MMEKALKDFHKQFDYRPEIKNKQKLRKYEKYIVVGMGGSALSAGLLKTAYPNLNLIIHKSYGLPVIHHEDKAKTLIIASSFSGNTEETIDGFKEALSQKIDVAAITTGGKLKDMAEKNKVPLVVVPDIGIEPRLATGYSLNSILGLIDHVEHKKLSSLVKSLNSKKEEEKARVLTEKILDKVPIIYSSARNEAIAYYWKIALNESGKIPAFCNFFPELNHNEMNSYESIKTTETLGEKFHFIFLKDQTDHPRIIKRMEVCKKLYEDLGYKVEVVNLEGGLIWQRIFSSILMAGWVALYISKYYGTEPEKVPMIETFKKLIK